MYKTLLFLLAGAAIAAEVKPLPAPVITGGMPLMEAINARQSGRQYNPEHKNDDQTLSEILWVAWGINTHGKRTIPTSRGTQNMGLYVLTPEGTWHYNATDNTLEKVFHNRWLIFNTELAITLAHKKIFLKSESCHTA